MREPPSDPKNSGSRTRLLPSRLAPSRARTFVQAVIAERSLSAPPGRSLPDRFSEEAAQVVSELVTNAVMHAGTEIDVVCRLETAAPRDDEDAGTDGDERTGMLVEVVDRQPSGQVAGELASRRGGRGLGLQIVGALAESWGVTYRRTEKVVWFRLAADEERHFPPASLSETLHRELDAADIFRPGTGIGRGNPRWSPRDGAFLAEASELLSGQLDEDMVAALAGQLLVPRVADWCAVWLSTDAGKMRLSRVWHVDERRIEALRRALEPDPPTPSLRTAGIPWPWPGASTAAGSALAFSLVAGGACLGTMVIGRSGPPGVADAAATRTVEDVARRIAQAVVTARQYTHQTTISRAFQRRQLPSSLSSLPGVESAIVYEPHGRGQTVGGDFYDLFPVGDNRWSFLLGDVQGKDPEAMSVTGPARQLVRLLAREGHGVESVLSRLNLVMAEEGAEASAGGKEPVQSRFLSLVYGELIPDPLVGGARCTLASAGHPPPLRLSADGDVVHVAEPQMLLGIDEETEFTADSFVLAPGETLLCVTDGVTERRNGKRQLDDDDGLAGILRGCVGLGAMAVAERVRQAAHDFGPTPVEDDLAVLTLHAVTK